MFGPDSCYQDLKSTLKCHEPEVERVAGIHGKLGRNPLLKLLIIRE
jgi:hypothetical protein